ncbi:MAG: hypothetical protein V1694_01110 [Candidatus Eisenbacteria bacterium]
MSSKYKHPEECHFCASDDVFLPVVELSGNDYAFCRKCLKSMTAEQFWRKLFESLGNTWPPKLS